MKTLTCSDAGFDCAAVIKGETEDEIMSKAGEHAMKEHKRLERLFAAPNFFVKTPINPIIEPIRI